MANKSSTKRKIKYKCPYCEDRYYKDDLVIHINDTHEDLIPEGFTALRIAFNSINKYPLDYSGKCTECGGPTRWDENKGRYNRQCDKQSCKESYLKKFEENMKRTKGVTRISSTPEGQEKMLANRKISGKYKFQNGVEKPYVGSYELKALEFMDKVMSIDPDDIMAPGPTLEYTYNDKKHFYISDFLYIPYNLIIEVKDGGNRPNKRNMPEYRAKQIEKEKYIISNTDYNYIRLTDNDFSQLLSVFMDLKMQLVDQTGDRVIHINEAMNALMTGYIPGFNSDGSAYMVNYMQNNVFSDDKTEFGITDSIKADNLIIRDKEGKLSKVDKDYLEDKEYDIYKLNRSVKEVSDLLKDHIGTEVSENFIYETVMNKKLYTYDQIKIDENATKVDSFETSLNYLSELTRDYLITDKTKLIDNINETVNLNNNSKRYILSSSRIPELKTGYDNLEEKRNKFNFLELITIGAN